MVELVRQHSDATACSKWQINNLCPHCAHACIAMIAGMKTVNDAISAVGDSDGMKCAQIVTALSKLRIVAEHKLCPRPVRNNVRRVFSPEWIVPALPALAIIQLSIIGSHLLVHDAGRFLDPDRGLVQPDVTERQNYLWMVEIMREPRSE